MYNNGNIPGFPMYSFWGSQCPRSSMPNPQCGISQQSGQTVGEMPDSQLLPQIKDLLLKLNKKLDERDTSSLNDKAEECHKDNTQLKNKADIASLRDEVQSHKKEYPSVVGCRPSAGAESGECAKKLNAIASAFDDLMKKICDCYRLVGNISDDDLKKKIDSCHRTMKAISGNIAGLKSLFDDRDISRESEDEKTLILKKSKNDSRSNDNEKISNEADNSFLSPNNKPTCDKSPSNLDVEVKSDIRDLSEKSEQLKGESKRLTKISKKNTVEERK